MRRTILAPALGALASAALLLACTPPRPARPPNLERFAQEAVVFERAFTPIPWTVGAHMSLLTSRYPTVHNVAHLERQSEVPKTFPEVLRETGYRTGAFVHPILDPDYDFGKGFDHDFRPPQERRAARSSSPPISSSG